MEPLIRASEMRSVYMRHDEAARGGAHCPAARLPGALPQ